MKHRFELSAIILAAGRSSRLANEHKLLLPFKGKTVVETVVDTALSVPFREVLIVVGAARDQLVPRLSDYPVTLVENKRYAAGMASSLVAGVAQASQDSQGFVILLGDMPLLSRQTLVSLSEAFENGEENQILAPVSKGRRGHPVIFASGYREELLHLKGDRGGNALLKRYGTKVSQLEVQDPGIFMDIDTWQDYDNLRQG